MTNAELWHLFPIFLTEHNPAWAEWYREEIRFLQTVLASDTVFHHIGSTAIEGIWAKPIVDILAECRDVEGLERAKSVLETHGYLTMSASARRISMNKGYTEDGFAEKVFHLHLRLRGDADEIYFCDYLNAHPEIAKQYETLKLRLWKEYEHDRDGYTNAKSAFVKRYTDLAKGSKD